MKKLYRQARSEENIETDSEVVAPESEIKEEEQIVRAIAVEPKLDAVLTEPTMVKVRYNGLTSAVFVGQDSGTVYHTTVSMSVIDMSRKDFETLKKLEYRLGDGKEKRPYFVLVE